MPDPEPVRIEAELTPRGPAAAVLLTDAQLEAIGHGAKTPAVHVTVNGGYTFAGRVGRMKGETMIGFNKAIRTAAGVEAGDTITIDVVLDEGPRTVEAPEALAAAFATEPEAAAGYEQLAPSHQKEYARWITEAKRPETRDKRVVEAIALLREGKARR